MAESYGLQDRFEKEVLHCLIKSNKFFFRLSKFIISEAFSDPIRCLIARAALAISLELKKAPGSEDVVLQRINRWSGEGTVSREQVVDACELIFDIQNQDSHLDEEAVINELVPVLQERRNRESLKNAMQLIIARESLSPLVEELQATGRLGQVERLIGMDPVSGAMVDSIERVRKTSRLSTGIWDLDGVLQGGIPVATLSVIMGPPGGGKSMFLTNLAGKALRDGLNVRIVTLELSRETWAARLMSHLSDVPTTHILDGSMAMEALDRVSRIKNLGRASIVQASQTTHVQEILDWVATDEAETGWETDLLDIDYADLIGMHKGVGTYEGQKEVYLALRQWALDRNKWTCTASATKRKDNPKHVYTLEDAGDSQHKPRISDLWLIGTPNSDCSQMDISVAKNRYGQRGALVTVDTDFSVVQFQGSKGNSYGTPDFLQ